MFRLTKSKKKINQCRYVKQQTIKKLWDLYIKGLLSISSVLSKKMSDLNRSGNVVLCYVMLCCDVILFLGD